MNASPSSSGSDSGGGGGGGGGGGSSNMPAMSRSAAYPVHSSGYRDLLVLEKKRKAREVATSNLNTALLEETLSGLRAKAQGLQNDRWMYEDVQL